MSLICVLAGCAAPPSGPVPLRSDPVPGDSDQFIMVWPTGEKPFQVEVLAKERRGDTWQTVLRTRPGVIGPKGFAKWDEKRESDGCTPRGVYRIGTAFGDAPTLDTGLDYRQATADDFWVDDADSPRYNRWVHGKPAAKSFEKLLQPAYKYAAVIEYNTDPVVPGAGSAIFLHVWSGPDRPTAGCVALAEADLKVLLKWLDRRRKPVILLNNG
jgi:L,D-peptidoglycan transpeptidase YkuD (ErfK/YbiS/YcfS/YnhG family)